ncbi:MAG: BF3164 family lipoprotein [Phocaeicola sp.]|nr:BF3164 family lipoprotein [Phocaeicola sp.]
MKLFLKKSLFAIVCCLVSACSHQKSYDSAMLISWSDFNTVECSDTLKLPNDCFLSMPLRILCIDSTLFVQNRKGDGFIQRFRLPQLTPIGDACISMGNGPLELLSAYRIQVVDSLFGVSDLMGSYFMVYNKDSACNSPKFPEGEKIRLEEPFSDVVLLPGLQQFVTTVLNTEHKRLTYFASDGTFRQTKGMYPFWGKELSPLEQMEGYACEMVVDPLNNHIWLFYKSTDLIEIYDYEGVLVKRMHGPDHFFPAVRELSNENGLQKVSSVSGETRDAYFCPLYSGGKVYVLYSGRVYREGQSIDSYLLDTILSFNLDGTPDKVYKLPVPVFTFAIDEINRTLYGLSFDPEYHLVKYHF